MEPDDPALVEAEKSYVKQLGQGRTKIDALMVAAEEKLAQLIGTGNGAGRNTADDIKSLHSVMEWLGRAAFSEVESLSDGHRQTARTTQKAQTGVYEKKMTTARKAAAVALQDKAVEVEASVTRKHETSMEASKGEGDDALRAAHRECAQKQAEVDAMVLKCSGFETALSMTKDLLRASEARLEASEAKSSEWEAKAGEWQAQCEQANELADEKEVEMSQLRAMLDKALSELTVESSKASSLEEKVDELLQEIKRIGADFAKAQHELDHALCEMGVVKEENMSMQEQIRKLVSEAAAAIETARERDRLVEQVRMLKGGIERLGDQLTKAKAEGESFATAKAALEAALADEREVVKEKTAALNAASARVEELQEASAGFMQKRAELEAALAKAGAQADGNAKKLEHANARLAALDAAVEAVNARLADVADAAADAAAPQPAGAIMVDEDVAPRAAAMVRGVDLAVGRLEKADGELAHAKGAVGLAVGELAQCRQALADLESRSNMLAQQLAAVTRERDELNDGAGAGAAALTALRAEVSQCIGRINRVLSPQERRLAGTGIVPLVAALLERFGAIERELGAMGDELAGAEGAMADLRNRLFDAESAGGELLKAEQEKARRERAVLVDAALGSMRLLRKHLVATLGGMREAVIAAPEALVAPPEGRKRVPHSTGRTDVLHLQLPSALEITPSHLPVTARGGERSPRGPRTAALTSRSPRSPGGPHGHYAALTLASPPTAPVSEWVSRSVPPLRRPVGGGAPELSMAWASPPGAGSVSVPPRIQRAFNLPAHVQHGRHIPLPGLDSASTDLEPLKPRPAALI